MLTGPDGRPIMSEQARAEVEPPEVPDEADLLGWILALVGVLPPAIGAQVAARQALITAELRKVWAIEAEEPLDVDAS